MPIGAPGVPVTSVFHFLMKAPVGLSSMTRPLPLSATYTLPDESTPTSRGCSNWMLVALAPLPSEPTRQTSVPPVVYSATWLLPVSAITMSPAFVAPCGTISMPDAYMAAWPGPPIVDEYDAPGACVLPAVA